MQNVTDNALSSEWIKLIPSIIFGILYIFLFGFNYLERYIRRNYLQKTMFSLHNDVFSEVLNKDLNSFNENKTSHYLSILSNDIFIHLQKQDTESF